MEQCRLSVPAGRDRSNVPNNREMAATLTTRGSRTSWKKREFPGPVILGEAHRSADDEGASVRDWDSGDKAKTLPAIVSLKPLPDHPVCRQKLAQEWYLLFTRTKFLGVTKGVVHNATNSSIRIGIGIHEVLWKQAHLPFLGIRAKKGMCLQFLLTE